MICRYNFGVMKKTTRHYLLPALFILALCCQSLFLPDYVAAQDTTCPGVHQDVSLPLTDMGAAEYGRMDGQTTDFAGGLYPDGRNERPPEHEAAGQAIAANIAPLNETGAPDPQNGKIGMISVGMSNTSSEFNTFMSSIHLDPQVNPQLVAVNGAQGGRVADNWSAEETDVWDNLAAQLHHRKVTPEQVQVAWIKLTLTRGGEFPEKAEELQGHLEIIVQKLKERFPNMQLIYLSSRTRSYTYERGLSPEPVAFETGFAVKWLIEKQINGDPALNFDPEKGEVLAPYLSWGPYLWIDGENERSDGRVWLAEDMAEDCTHPSASGNQKVAEMLYEFFLTDSTTGWFRSDYVPVLAATSAPTAAAVAEAAATATTTASATAVATNTPMPTETATEAATEIVATTVAVVTTKEATAVAQATPSLPPSTPETSNTSSNLLWPMVALLLLVILLGLGWVIWRRNRNG